MQCPQIQRQPKRIFRQRIRRRSNYSLKRHRYNQSTLIYLAESIYFLNLDGV